MKPGIDKYMAVDLDCFKPEDDIVYATRVLLDRHFSGAPVVDSDGNLVGVLSKKDCMKIIYNTAYHQDWGGQVALTLTIFGFGLVGAIFFQVRIGLRPLRALRRWPISWISQGGLRIVRP